MALKAETGESMQTVIDDAVALVIVFTCTASCIASAVLINIIIRQIGA